MTKLLRHTLIVGLNDKDTKTQLVSIAKAKKAIAKICGDCTMTNAIGHYTHEDGSTVNEKAIKVEMLFKADNQVMAYAQRIKKEFNQESVALVKDYIESALI